MAERRPLVVVSGQVQELPSGDTLPGGGSADSISNTPAGGVAATTVQAAINELDSEKVAKTGDTMTGNLNFSGTGLRLKGDFSNATPANRLMFQTSTVNADTVVGVLPNGTGNEGRITLYGGSDPANCSQGDFRMLASEMQIRSNALGSGVLRPITFYTSGSEALRIDTTGNVRVTGSGGLGYGVGSGGAVTQATSKSTAVTLNKPSGQITMNNAPLGAGASVIFQVNNSLLSTSDSILLTCPFISVGPNNYRVEVVYSSNGSFNIRVTNIATGSLSEALQINFAIIKGATT